MNLRDYELHEMHKKFDKISEDNGNLREQLEKLGSDLSSDMDHIKTEKEKLQVNLTK